MSPSHNNLRMPIGSNGLLCILMIMQRMTHSCVSTIHSVSLLYKFNCGHFLRPRSITHH